MNNPGYNCPSEKIVSTTEDCKAAAAQFGCTYREEKIKESEKPAGCHFRSSSNEVFFNEIVDISDTDNINVRFRGVCVGGNSSFYRMMYYQIFASFFVIIID